MLTAVAKVPSFHIMVKLHKDPVGLSFVAGSPIVPFTSESNGWFETIMPDEQGLEKLDGIQGLAHMT